MDIHIVQPGDTMYRLAQQYGVPMERLIQDNQLPDPSHLVVGQTIVVQYPELTHTVRAGDSLYSIAQMHNTTATQLLRNNPALQGRDLIYPGQHIVVKYASRPRGPLTVNAYAYPYIDPGLLRATLPYLSQLTPFTYRFDEEELIPLRDESLVNAALQSRVAPILHLSNLDEDERFSAQLAHELLEDEEDQRELIQAILRTVDRRGYQGVDVDFEYILAEDAGRYASFLARLRQGLAPRGLPLIAALAPKTSADQPGRLYEGIDYRLIAQAVDFALLMTYEWGYTYGPPMAVSPINQVRKVLDYAVSEIPREKILMGMPNYGYDWKLPFVKGETRAEKMSSEGAFWRAQYYNAEVVYDQLSQAPYFTYFDPAGNKHVVWFEDIRSIRAKLALVEEYDLAGVGYWDIMDYFPANSEVLNEMYQVRKL